MDNNETGFNALIDRAKFTNDVQNAKNELEGLATYTRNIGNEAMKLNGLFGKAFSGLKDQLPTDMLKQFASEVIRVRGTFQDLEATMSTMLGSKEKATVLMSEITAMAAKTPFSVEEIAAGSTQLLAFGTEAGSITETLSRLGDIASGVSMPLSELISLYGTTLSQGQLCTQDLDKFTGSGIPMIGALASQLGIAETNVRSLVEQGKIGFPEVQEAIESLTGKGGIFYQMMESKSATLPGQIKNLNDAWNQMLNEIGQGTEGVASAGINGLTTLVNNYQQVGKVLISLITTYGVARTATIAYDVIKASDIALDYAKLVVTGKLEVAMKALNLTMLKNPYVAAIALVSTLVTMMWALHDSTTAAERAQKEFNEKEAAAAQATQQHKQKIEELISQIGNAENAETDRISAMEQLKSAYPGIIQKYIDEEGHLRNISALKKDIADMDSRAGIIFRKKQLDRSTSEVENLQEELHYRKEERDISHNAPRFKFSKYKKMSDSDVKNELEKAIATESTQMDKVSQDISNMFTSKIRSFTDAQITDAINIINQKIGNANAGEKINLKLLGNNGAFTDKQANSLVNNLETEQKRRSSRTNYGQDYINAEKEWNEAKKALEAIENDKSLFFTEQHDNAKLRYTEANEKFKSLGGDTESKTLANNTNSTEVENKKNLAYQLQQISFQNEQAEIDGIKDTEERKLKQIELNYRKEYELIQQKEAELVKLNKNKKLSGEDQEIINSWKTRTDNNRKNEIDNVAKSKSGNAIENQKKEEASRNAYLKEYGNYQDKKIAIQKEYEEKRNNTKDEYAIQTLNKEEGKVLQDLHISMIQKTDLWKNLFSDASDHTIGFINKSIEETEQLRDYLNGVEGVEIPAGFSKEQIDALKNNSELVKTTLDQLARKRDELGKRNPFIGLIQGFEDLKNAGDDSEKQFKATKDIIGSMQAISSVIGQVGKSLESLGGKTGEVMGQISGVIGQAASMASMGASLGGVWGAAAGAAVGLATSLVSIFSKSKDNKKELEIKRLQGEIDTLQTAYDNLGEAIEGAYSKDASDMIKQQNEMLEQQKLLIQNQMLEEQGKKNADNGKIEAYQKQIDQINDTISDNKVKAQDAIFGTDVKSAIDEFAQAYADAWASGNDKAQAMKDVVKNMIKGTIMVMIKSDFAPTVQKIRDRIEQMLTDGIISDYEQLELDKIIEAEASKADQKFSWADKYLKEEKEEDKKEETRKEGSSGRSFETMSQDSADELNGRFTALQMAGEEIKLQSVQQNTLLLEMSVNMDTVKLYTQSIATGVSEMKDIALTSMNHLWGIEKNTRHLQFMREDLARIKDKVNYL